MANHVIDRDVNICVMGVSGVGKTTVGEDLATRLGRSFGDADDLHPQANVDKMASGIPLTDADRAPWLDAVVDWLDGQPATSDGVVFACSALKRRYRDRIAQAKTAVFFIHLTADADALEERLTTRKGHFMHVDMLESQLADLEPIGGDENGVAVSTAGSVSETVDAVLGSVQID